MTADETWEALNAALHDITPLCQGRELFTTDGLADEDLAVLATICARCPVAGLSNSYATAAKVTSGFWAGRYYSSKARKRPTEVTSL